MQNLKFNINALLEIETHPDLFQYRLTNSNFLLWPLIRFYLLQSTLNIEYLVNDPWVSETTFTKKLKYWVLSFLKSPLRVKEQKDILIVGTDVSNIKINGKYFNRLSEYFAGIQKEKTLVIERSNLMIFKTPRTFSPLCYNDWIIIKANIKDKILSILGFNRNKSRETIDKFISFLKANYVYNMDEKTWGEIKNKLTIYDRILNDIYKSYFELFKRTKPKLVLVEDACYGDYLSIIVKAAKDKNIYVCEYQHGLVSENQVVYNYAHRIQQEYLDYLPDEYLSYGPYWGQFIRLPIKIRPIGNPHLEENNMIYKNTSKREYYITYISSGLDAEKSINFLIHLQKLLNKGNKIAFRPHPCEIARVHNLYGEIINKDIIIDFGNLYSTIVKSSFIISELSTVVYEAIAFNSIVFVIDSEYSRLYSGKLDFNYINSPEDVINLIEKKNYKTIQSRLIWSKRWRQNYMDLLKELNIC